MAEQSIIWVSALLIDKALGRVEEPKKKSKKAKSHEDQRSAFSWIRCFLLSGGISDDEVTIEIVETDPDLPLYKKGEKVTVKTEKGEVLMGNSFVKPPDDLISMTHLHEPAVVYSLMKRFEEDTIYTATGPILLGINPFKRIGTLYDEDKMMQYWKVGEGIDTGKLEPHIFGFADRAFRQMITGILEKKGGDELASINQSVLVSGESGAGKTVTVKFIMKYLASLSSRKQEYLKKKRSASPGRGQKVMMQGRKSIARGKSWMAGAQVEEKILQSSELLESFGNARTVRNDNSSRFGKYIELQFKDTGSLIGAKMDTYLLEKVRLVIQMPGERNYHIFYQILDGATDEEREKFFLGKFQAQDFRLTNRSGTYDRRDGVPDGETFEELLAAMGTMGFEEELQDSIFAINAAFLHASNIVIEEITDDSCKLAATNPHLDPVLTLLGLERQEFEESICQYEIEVGGKTFNKNLNVESAEKALLSLVSNTFGAMFDYIVDRINSSVDCVAKGDGSAQKAGFIGLLDIFGFEAFESNSFEQLCINYCNEMLQQQFNLHVFKTEQDTYKEEGINWSSISFPDNDKIIELISKKNTGILSILTDACKQSRGNDKSFGSALYKQCDKHPNFSAPSLMQAKLKFIVIHYAGQVEYDINGFVEKNKDEVPRKASTLLENSTVSLVQLFGKMMAPPVSKSGRTAKRKTAGDQFIKQLAELKKRITETAPHYIRCLKPNQQLKPSIYNKTMICDQLRYAGVLEAIKVSRLGFPARFLHKTFAVRYKFLSDSGDLEEVTKKAAELILKSTGKQATDDPLMAAGVQKGKTKVFLTTVAYESLEKIRTEKMFSAAVKIQSLVRMFLVRCNYIEDKKRIVKCQAYIRGFLCRKLFQQERKRIGATGIQSAFRMWILRKKFKAQKAVAIWCQKLARGAAGRKVYKKLYEEHQKEQAVHKLLSNSAVLIQCIIRARRAKQAVKIAKEGGTKAMDELKKKARFHFEKDREDVIADEETVTELLKENKSVALQADKSAAMAVQEKAERRREVSALQKSLCLEKAEAAKNKQALAEVGAIQSDMEKLKEELAVAMEENKRLKSLLEAAEAENEQLKEGAVPRAAVCGYDETRYGSHQDLKKLDEEVYNLKERGKQGKKDLEALIMSLAVLK